MARQALAVSLGRTSIQALSEFYAVSTRKFGVPAHITWVEVARYFPWDPQPTDEELLRAGREIELRYKLSWWDSMIVAAAQLQDCVLLLTEDLQDGAVFGAVTVRSPFTLEVREAAAHYTVEPSRPPAHRPRGRPKRVAAYRAFGSLTAVGSRSLTPNLAVSPARRREGGAISVLVEVYQFVGEHSAILASEAHR